MRRYLVIANQTLGGDHLTEVVREALAAGPSEFHVLVPASHGGGHAVWTEGEATAEAQHRLDRALEHFRALGADATGEVGDASPIAAARDVLRDAPFDEIILSTLPAGPSRWLKQDTLARLHKITEIPVRHVVGDLEHASSQ
jgi:GABA permease